MKTIGDVIVAARKKAGLTLIQLGNMIGLSKSAVAAMETNQSKGGPDAQILIRTSETLQAPEILLHYCETCPIRNHIFIKFYPDLNNIRREPAVIAARLRKEMMEAIEALDQIGERFSDKDFKSRPDYQEQFKKSMEQVLDVERGIEVLKFELLLSGIHTKADLQEVYDRQQAKCEAHGHHKPVKKEEVGIMPKTRPYQVRREQLTAAEWDHLSNRLFPLMRELKAKARANIARKTQEGESCEKD